MTIINQCDGCNSKAPLANGNHLDGRGLPYMACQADRYRDACGSLVRHQRNR